MGTVFTVRIDDEADPGVVDEVVAWWREVEARFSTFRDDSEISLIGRGLLDVDRAHPDVRHVLATCEEIVEASGGVFSIRPGRPGGPGLDPAAYVKGWSVDEAALILRSAGVGDFVLYAGGDVLCSGSPEDDEAWRVGIRDPRHHDRSIAVVTVARGAVATSGAYERGSHVWGPAPGKGLGSVTVLGPSLGTADALATAVFAGGVQGPFGWLARFTGYCAVLVRDDGSMASVGPIPAGFTIGPAVAPPRSG